MRQDVQKNSTSTVVWARPWLASLVLVSAAVGCQLPIPPSLPTQSPYNSTLKAPTDTDPPSTPSTPLAATARIRGQSGDGWAASTAGNNDNYKTPMAATNAAQPTNRYTSSPSGQPPATGLIQTAPPTPGTPAAYPGVGVGGTSATANLAPGAAASPPAAYTSQQPPTGATYGNNNYGYGPAGSYAPQGSYGATIAPGVTQPLGSNQSAVAPGVYPGIDPMAGINAPEVMIPNQYQPRVRIAPLDVYLQEGRTGRIVLGGSVNSDLGVAGQVIIEERNFDIRRFPNSWDDVWSGRAFRGDGQNFRAELMPGNRVERYTVNWSTRNLFGYLPYSFSVGGFLYSRQFRDWTEQRLGGRMALGYEVTKDLSISSELRLEDVKLFDPRLAGVSELDDALGSNDLYTGRFRIAHDTRDSPFMSTEGSLLELIYDQVFGEYDYPRGQINYSRYFLMRERPDGGGRHTLASTWKVGITGSQTPIFENYYAGGYSTMRGFSFRGASPKVGDVQVGGELMFLGSLEYVFPLTADEMLRGVAFVDYGTVEQDLEINSENFRVAPGLGLRITVPALGPAPLAFDFAYPINHADTDDRQVFSFFMGFTR